MPEATSERQPRGIDCDVHAPLPEWAVLERYLPPVWQQMCTLRGIRGLPETHPPPTAPIACRPEWRDADGRPARSIELLIEEVLVKRHKAAAVVHCLYPVQRLYDPAMTAAIASACNSYLEEQVLPADDRLYGSILIAPQDPVAAATEIRARSENPRFVQSIMLASAELPYGDPCYAPIWDACSAAGLPVALHLGNAGRHPQTASGWASYQFEDAVDQNLAFQAQLASLITRGVLEKWPELTFVLLESGVTWLPAFGWRLGKFWRGTRIEVPWIKRPPIETLRERVRLSLRPFDAPASGPDIEAWFEHAGADDLFLYASDYPHWHGEEEPDGFPVGLPEHIRRKAAIDNPHALYPRIAS